MMAYSLALGKALDIFRKMCGLQCGTDHIEEKDADDTFHDKSRNLCSTCIDTAVKNRTADEITDHHITIPTTPAMAVRILNILAVSPVRLAM